MRWYKTQHGVVGDGPIDLMDDVLKRVVDCYLHELGRLPTMGELGDLFNRVTGGEMAIEADRPGAPVDLAIHSLSAVEVPGSISGDVFVMPTRAVNQIKERISDLVETTGQSRRLFLVDTAAEDMMSHCLRIRIDYQGPRAQEVSGLWIDLKKFEVNPTTGQPVS